MVSDIQEYEREGKTIIPVIKSSNTSNRIKVGSGLLNLDQACFETAITETQFGRFNVLLVLITILPSFSQVFETVSMSYVMPIAQCDLSLTLEDKGILNGVTFAGMISSSIFWGYLCDTLGRKRIIVTGYFLVGFFALMASLSHNVIVLIISKFFSGFIINGPFTAATSYLSEFHSSKFRARVHMARGAIIGLACIILPLLAWGILPRNWNFKIGYINIHSWNVFLLCCSMVPFASGTAFIFMPESPKFLMAVGKNKDALKVFQQIYMFNTGKPRDTYPIKQLVEEITQKTTTENNGLNMRNNSRPKNMIVNWANQMRAIFLPPHILKLLLGCSNLFLVLMSVNTLNLWLPQLFQEINDYQFNNNGSSSDICEMLAHLRTNNESDSSLCSVNLENTSVYTNAILVGTARMIGIGVAVLFVNLLGKKTLLIIMASISGCFATSLYFALNTHTMLALASLHLASAGICQNILVTIALELFPTTLRTIALSMHMTSGRISTVIGNRIFPSLLHAGCLPPFIFLGSLMLGSAILSFLYPSTENKPLE